MEGPRRRVSSPLTFNVDCVVTGGTVRDFRDFTRWVGVVLRGPDLKEKGRLGINLFSYVNIDRKERIHP